VVSKTLLKRARWRLLFFNASQWLASVKRVKMPDCGSSDDRSEVQSTPSPCCRSQQIKTTLTNRVAHSSQSKAYHYHESSPSKIHTRRCPQRFHPIDNTSSDSSEHLRCTHLKLTRQSRLYADVGRSAISPRTRIFIRANSPQLREGRR
jgi:hypothetical protein